MKDLKLGDLVLFNDDILYKEGLPETYKIMAADHKNHLFFVDNKWVKPNQIRKYEAPIIQQKETQIQTTLPTESKERKNYPLFRGCLRYFPAALAGIAKTSKLGNDKHNPGKELHHARGKSVDHGDCILRHLIDTEDLLAALNRGQSNVTPQDVLLEVNQMAWRVLAFSQELHEKFGAPLAPGAEIKSKRTLQEHAGFLVDNYKLKELNEEEQAAADAANVEFVEHLEVAKKYTLLSEPSEFTEEEKRIVKETTELMKNFNRSGAV